MRLGGLQALLRELYALDLEYDVDDFLTTDTTFARALDAGGRELDEKLLIAETDGEAEVSLYLEPRVLERLARSDPPGGWPATGSIATGARTATRASTAASSSPRSRAARPTKRCARSCGASTACLRPPRSNTSTPSERRSRLRGRRGADARGPAL